MIFRKFTFYCCCFVILGVDFFLSRWVREGEIGKFSRLNEKDVQFITEAVENK